MAKAEPLNNADRITLDGLDQMFSEATEGEKSHGDAVDVSQSGEELALDLSEQSTDGVRIHKVLPNDLFTRGLDNLDEALSNGGASSTYYVHSGKTSGKSRKNTKEARKFVETEKEVSKEEITSRAHAALDLQGSFVDEDDRVSRSDLVNILEGFVRLLRKDGESQGRLNLARTQQIMSAADASKVQDIYVEDKTAELEEMRRLVIEAQETIIKLLTDRVEDRARIATLETELRLLPDLQDQADRAMAVAFRTEEFRSELHKVKFELERYRLANVRHSERGPKALFNRVRKWFLKGQAMAQRDFS